MKKKQVIILGVVIGLLVLIGIGIWLQKDSNSNEKQDVSESSISEEEKEQDDVEQEESKEEAEEEKKTSEEKATTNIREWLEEEANPDSKFPYQIPNTSLVVRAVKSYNGVFIEDGSDKDVYGISAIIVDNVGEEYIEYAKITLECDDKNLVYELSALPSGGTMVVWESSASVYSDGEYGQCSAEVAKMTDFEMSENLVKVTETESGSLQVENISGQDIPCVRVFYKFYMEDLKVYVGGITYTAKVEQLKAGEIRHITPTHYDADASCVVMVRTYDEN